MSDLIGNPEDRFSHDAAHILIIIFADVSLKMNVFVYIDNEISCIMRKPGFCICKNKGADQQQHGSHAADQRLCLGYKESTIPLLPEFKISSL